ERSNYPLTAIASPGRELGVGLSYDRSRLSDEVAERMGGHLARLLEEMVARPRARLWELGLPDAGETARLRAWGSPAAPFGHDRRAPEPFAAQVGRAPGAGAAGFAGGGATYRQMA